MSLHFRAANTSDFSLIEQLVIEAFEPITWAKKLDDRMEPLNGLDWRKRWQARLQNIFNTQIILAGEADQRIQAMSSGTLDRGPALAYIDLIAVDRRAQGRGFGREMLRGMMEHMKNLGAKYINLDCLVDNDTANGLYRSEGFEEVARHIRWFRRLS